MTRLVLVRHAAVVQDSQAPVEAWPLSAEGERAAARLKEDSALAGVSAIYSSPETKALATARAFAGRREVRVVDDLRELDRRAVGWFGEQAEYVTLVEQILERPEQRVRGCERAVDAERRIIWAIETIFAETADVGKSCEGHPDSDVAVVSHGLVLTLYLSRLLGLPGPSLEIWRSIRFPDVAVVGLTSGTLARAFGDTVRLP